MTLRLPAGLAAGLDLVARFDQLSRTDVVRAALARYLSARIAQSDFQALLQADIDRLTAARQGSVPDA